MSSHVHLIVVPEQEDSLAVALKGAHGRYATYFNARRQSSGHVWQGRFYSCPLDTAHLWTALRYTERNPVRAGLVEAAEDYRWSSAPVHCGARSNDGLLDLELWGEVWTTAAWAAGLRGSGEEEADRIRRNTHTGRPLGSPEFVRELEEKLHRPLAPRAGGRPAKQADARQTTLAFGAE